MIIFMRTTVVLDDRLFRSAKQRAAALGTSLSEVVNQALRDLLAREPIRPQKFRMITHGRGAKKLHHEPSDLADELEHDDLATIGR
jgi:Arc/MetJ family transcription regulator